MISLKESHAERVPEEKEEDEGTVMTHDPNYVAL